MKSITVLLWGIMGFVLFVEVMGESTGVGQRTATNCNLADYESYYRNPTQNPFGLVVDYGTSTTSVTLQGYGPFKTVVFEGQPTNNSFCNYDASKQNGWTVQALDTNGCVVKLTRTFSNADYFARCTDPKAIPGGIEYSTDAHSVTFPFYTDTLPDGTPQYVSIDYHLFDNLGVPTNASGIVTITIYGPEEYKIMIHGVMAVVPGTDSVSVIIIGQINYPYTIKQIISPPLSFPSDVVSSVVLPLQITPNPPFWTTFESQVLSLPKYQCLVDGTFDLQFEVGCQDNTLCDMQVFNANQFIHGTVSVYYPECTNNHKEGSATIALFILDPKTGLPTPVIEAGKPFWAQSVLTVVGPEPIANIGCTYSFDESSYSGALIHSYTQIENDPRFSPSFVSPSTNMENTLQFTFPDNLIDPNGGMITARVTCQLPRPNKRQTTVNANSAIGVFGFGFKTSQEITSSTKYIIIGVCSFAGVALVVVGVIAAVFISKRKPVYDPLLGK